MHNFEIEVDFLGLPSVKAELELAASYLAPDKFRNYIGAVEGVAEDAESKYRGYLLGQAIPGRGAINHPKAALAQAVFRRHDGLLLWALGNSTAYAAQAIEEGAPERDMKKNIASFPKARRAKAGHAYLIIPFRHDTPETVGGAAMPQRVYKMAKALSASTALGPVGERPNAMGGMVEKKGYRWGGRLTHKMLHATSLPDSATKRFEGMVRFTTSAGKGVSSSYMTFRVMSERSRPGSWIRKAIVALHPLEEAINQAFLSGRPDIEASLREDLSQMPGR